MAREYVRKKNRMSAQDREQLIRDMEAEMREAARALDFERAAELRDMIFELKSE